MSKAHAGFDVFFDRSYASVVDLLTEVFDSTTVGLDEARSAFASTYRFWSKLGPHDEPLDWTLTDAFARQRRRWTADATDSMTPTVGHSAAVLRRHGFSDSQLRTITGPARDHEPRQRGAIIQRSPRSLKPRNEHCIKPGTTHLSSIRNNDGHSPTLR